MWLFTSQGFFTCACDTKHGPLNTDVIMVRARVADHIENLQEKFPEIADLKIEYNPTYDYEYRIYVPKDVWARIVAELVKEMDYGKFKPSALHWFNKNDKNIGNYYDLLLEVWRIMCELE